MAEGKKSRKFGRNKRKPGGARQEQRTEANKRRRVLREARKSTSYKAPGWIIEYRGGGVQVVRGAPAHKSEER